MPAGRPTDYRPEYCERVIELGMQGLLPVQMAVDIGVCKSTLHLWASAHPEFMDAFTRGREAAEAFHMGRAVQTAHGDRPGNAPMTKFILSAAFGYREASESVNTMQNQDGAPLQTVAVRFIEPKQADE